MDNDKLITVAIVVITSFVIFAGCEMKLSSDKTKFSTAAIESKCSQKLINVEGHSPYMLWDCNEK